MRNAANTFSVSPTTLSAVDPVLRFVDTGAPTDGKEFDIQDIGAELTFKAYDDSQLPQSTPLRLLRDGSVIVDDADGAGGLSTTPLNATNLTSGTVPDARLCKRPDEADCGDGPARARLAPPTGRRGCDGGGCRRSDWQLADAGHRRDPSGAGQRRAVHGCPHAHRACADA
jgi:hypothetical protein